MLKQKLSGASQSRYTFLRQNLSAWMVIDAKRMLQVSQ